MGRKEVVEMRGIKKQFSTSLLCGGEVYVQSDSRAGPDVFEGFERLSISCMHTPHSSNCWIIASAAWRANLVTLQETADNDAPLAIQTTLV